MRADTARNKTVNHINTKSFTFLLGIYMKFKALVIATAVSTTILTGCATSQSTDTVSRDVYNTEIAKRDAELSRLRGQASSATASASAASASTAGGAASSNAVVNSELFPPNPQPGHCYARLLTPATYETTSEKVLVREESESVKVIPATYQTVEERLLVREASTRVEAIPATFKTVTEQVLIKPASKKLIPYPAEYATETEQVLVKEASSKLVAVPATYDTVSEQILDKPAHTVWKRGSGFQSAALQTSYDQSTGEIMCLVEVPATYKTVTKTVLKSPATTKTVEIPAVYKTVSKTVLKKPAGFKEVAVPAVYETVTKTVIDQPASTREITIPAEYRTVSVQKVASAASEKRTVIPAEYGQVSKRKKVTEEKLAWEEVICRDNINDGLITRLQQSLAKAGYYKGPIDGIYGSMTRTAINKYSTSKNIAKSGTYIPLATAELLGVSL